MAIDSTSELLFSIGADTSDAEGNVQRFRALLGKDLDDLSAEFGDWSNKVFGDLTTVQGAMTATAAGFAAAVVTIAGAAVALTSKYEDYINEVNHASKVTGIHIDDMSKLAFAAQMTGTNMDSLTRGLAFFEQQVVKANAGGQQQVAIFQQLGVSQAQLAAGEKNILPLLGDVMDKFQGLASGTEKAAIARELFSRGGSELQGFLKLGKDGLKAMADEAERLGIVLGEKDILAMKEHKVAQAELKASFEAFAITIGQQVLPLLTAFSVGLVGLAETIRSGALTDGQNFFAAWVANTQAAADRMKGLVAMIAGGEHSGGLDLAGATKQATQEFYGLSSILQQVNEKTAGATSEEAKLIAEVQKLQAEVVKAGQEYNKLKSEGTLAGDAAKREADAMAKLPAAMGAMIDALYRRLQDKRAEEQEKAREAEEGAAADLRQRISAQQEQTIEVEEQHWNEEVDKLRESFQKRKVLTAENEDLIAQLRAVGLQKIHRDQVQAYADELVQLQSHMAQMVAAHMTAQERLDFQYQQDLARFSEVEMEKFIREKGLEDQRASIEQQYALNRKAVNDKYAMDLQALQNSQGWQGVFGNKFAQAIKGNEALWREWATSANQSLMMVRVTMEALKELGGQTFEQFAQGMGQNIADAIVYQKSIGEAMRSALAATLESLAAQALTYAIYSAALGFLRLAEHDYPGAASAFTSAAIWGTVGGVAAIAGRAIAPPSATAAGSTAASAASSPAAAAGSVGSTDTGTGQQAPQIVINVNGHLYGNADALIDAINEAVLERDKFLASTMTTSGKVLYR